MATDGMMLAFWEATDAHREAPSAKQVTVKERPSVGSVRRRAWVSSADRRVAVCMSLGLPDYSAHALVGPIAETIVDQAGKCGSNVIYMGTRGMTALSNMVLGSVATRVLHLAQIPVVLIHQVPAVGTPQPRAMVAL